MKYGKVLASVVILLLFAGAVFYFFIDQKEGGGPAPEKSLPEEKITLYFLDREKYILKPVERSVAEASDKSTRIDQIIQELPDSPTRPNLVSLLPEDVELRTSYVDGQTVFLDFNDELVGTAEGSSGEMMLLYSIVNSVLENLQTDYKLVQFLIEGEMRKTIGPYGEESGHIAIKYPLGPRWNLADTS